MLSTLIFTTEVTEWNIQCICYASQDNSLQFLMWKFNTFLGHNPVISSSDKSGKLCRSSLTCTDDQPKVRIQTWEAVILNCNWKTFSCVFSIFFWIIDFDPILCASRCKHSLICACLACQGLEKIWIKNRLLCYRHYMDSSYSFFSDLMLANGKCWAYSPPSFYISFWQEICS